MVNFYSGIFPKKRALALGWFHMIWPLFVGYKLVSPPQDAGEPLAPGTRHEKRNAKFPKPTLSHRIGILGPARSKLQRTKPPFKKSRNFHGSLWFFSQQFPLFSNPVVHLQQVLDLWLQLDDMARIAWHGHDRWTRKMVETTGNYREMGSICPCHHVAYIRQRCFKCQKLEALFRKCEPGT